MVLPTFGPTPVDDLLLCDYEPRSCLVVPEHPVERARFRAIDAHNHLGRWLSADGSWIAPDVEGVIATLEACNIGACVNLDGRRGDELEANLDRYDRRWPDRFATFCHVDWEEAKRPGFPERLVASLRQSAATGAKGLKVWKDLGLAVEDAKGKLLLPDDERLAPLWATAGELGLPVLIHTADPVAFFQPIDRFNERYEELIAHPDWSFADSRFPRFERLMDAFEAIVASHPDTTFIGAHVGGYAENLGWVSRLLDAYPNAHVDMAARINELGRQPRATRALIERHPDRVLFGTDVYPPQADRARISFRFLETEDESFPYSTSPVGRQGRWRISGLGLPDDLLSRVYRDNALRLLPSLKIT